MRNRFAAKVVFLTVAIVTIPSLHAQPITFPTSMSVGEGDLFIRVQPWYTSGKDDPPAGRRRLTEWTVRMMGIYGLTRRFAVLAVLPFVDRRWRQGGAESNDRGIGNLELFLRQTVLEKNWPRRTFSVSPFLGAIVPRGNRDGVSSSLGSPPKSGLGYVVGFAVRDATFGRPHRFLSAQYSNSSAVEGAGRGHGFRVDGAIKPGLLSWTTRSGEAVGINGMLEVNFRWSTARNPMDRMPPTGGSTLALTSGIVFTRHRLILEAAVRESNSRLRGRFRSASG